MNILRAALSGETKQRKQAIAISIVLVAVGVALIVVGALAEWGWTRVIGAGLISVGGIGLGVLLGLIPKQREQVLAQLRRWRTGVVVLAIIVLVLPILAALAAGVIGAFLGGGGNATPHVLGTIVGLLLFAGVAASAWIGVRVALRATRTDAETAQPKEGAA